jgi:hypothetical protein
MQTCPYCRHDFSDKDYQRHVPCPEPIGDVGLGGSVVDVETLERNEEILNPRPQFADCGSCGSYHPVDFYGDCRDDSNRFTCDYLDEKYGEAGWLAL